MKLPDRTDQPRRARYGFEWEAFGTIREGFATVIGGARGCVGWLRFADAEIEHDAEACERRIAKCELLNTGEYELGLDLRLHRKS